MIFFNYLCQFYFFNIEVIENYKCIFNTIYCYSVFLYDFFFTLLFFLCFFLNYLCNLLIETVFSRIIFLYKSTTTYRHATSPDI